MKVSIRSKISLMLLMLISAICPLQAAPGDEITYYKLSDVVGETIQGVGIGDFLNPESKRKITYGSFLSSLLYARNNPNLKAVIIYPEGAMLGLAQLEEINRQLMLIKESGKEVIFFTRDLDNSKILLSSGTRTVLMPEGSVFFNGINMENMYFKGLLDKLKIKADVVHIGDFKSAFEPFYLTQPSEPAKKQNAALMNGLFNNIVGTIAKNNQSNHKDIKALADRALLDSAQAKKSPLVDELLYHDQLITQLKNKYPHAKWIDSAGIPKARKTQITGLGDIIRLLQPRPKKTTAANSIFLCYLDGGINMQMALPLRKAILKAAKDPNIKVMVLRINSPGGSALASEVIWRATAVFKKTGKPIVISMGNVAASGGYYAAMEGDIILAEKNTITGSIGVIGAKIVFGDMLNELGINVHRQKTSSNADIMSPFSIYSVDQRKIVREHMTTTYKTFLKHVSEGREGKLKKSVEQLAGGRVYTGTRALELGLIDEIGGLREAIAKAKTLAKLNKYSISNYPEAQSMSQLMENMIFGQQGDGADPLLQLKAMQLLQRDPATAASLNSLPPQVKQGLLNFLERLQMMKENRIMLLAPQFQFPNH